MNACNPERGSSRPTFSLAAAALSRRGNAYRASALAAATPKVLLVTDFMAASPHDNQVARPARRVSTLLVSGHLITRLRAATPPKSPDDVSPGRRPRRCVAPP